MVMTMCENNKSAIAPQGFMQVCSTLPNFLKSLHIEALKSAISLHGDRKVNVHFVSIDS